MRKLKIIPAKTRMAGDNDILKQIDQVLEVIKEDDIMEERAFYNKIKAREDEIESAFVSAGLTPEQAKAVQIDTDSITDAVPAAYAVRYQDGVRNDGGALLNEDRYHTRYEYNPLTEQTDIVPFLEPGTNKPMVTRFGQVGQGLNRSDVDYMPSNEFLAKRVLQLIGVPTEANNARGRSKYNVDLISDKGTKIDAEVIQERYLPEGAGFQVYTETATPSTVGKRGRTIAQAVGPLVRGQMKQQQMGLEEAVNRLADRGQLTNASGDARPYGGKLLKEDGKYADKLLFTVMKDEDGRNNIQPDESGRKYNTVTPLIGAFGGDVQKAIDRLNSMAPTRAANSLSFRPMPGNNGNRPSAKIYMQVPLNARGVVTDLSQLPEPYVRQLFYEQ